MRRDAAYSAKQSCSSRSRDGWVSDFMPKTIASNLIVHNIYFVKKACVASSRRELVEESFAVGEVVAPVRTVDIVQSYRAAAVRGMHETAFANVDADMADSTADAEENQVATHQVVHASDLDPVERCHVARTMRQHHVGGVAVDVVHQAAAIEAAFGCIAAIVIRRTDQRHGTE